MHILGIQFPKSFLNNNIVIKRRENSKHLTTKECIAAFCETMDDLQLSEIDWGKPQGKEICN